MNDGFLLNIMFVSIPFKSRVRVLVSLVNRGFKTHP